jgi:capsular exopolysaccharide synthesis family protein
VVRTTALPLLAAIPRIAVHNGRRRHRAPAEQIETRLVIRHSPKSPAAEAYRALRTNVAFAATRRERPLRTMVVTSPEPQDGKTTTAANFAITLAEQGHRVMLVAADLRRPVLHRVLHHDRAPGLTEVLDGAAPLDSVIHRIPLPEHATGSLDFIAAGKPVPNPAERLGAPAMERLLATLAERYDAVVFDTPPLSVVTDAAVLGRVADGVILVARMGATHTESLKRSAEELDGIGVRVVGTVLTDVHHSEDRYGYRYGYDQYYHYYVSDEDGDGGPRATARRRS